MIGVYILIFKEKNDVTTMTNDDDDDLIYCNDCSVILCHEIGEMTCLCACRNSSCAADIER